MALIGSGAYGANLAKLMWNHVHKCFWMAKYRKPKSFKQPFFDWIKITDFLIAKLIIFWEWKMTPKNSQFCYKKICNFDPIKTMNRCSGSLSVTSQQSDFCYKSRARIHQTQLIFNLLSSSTLSQANFLYLKVLIQSCQIIYIWSR